MFDRAGFVIKNKLMYLNNLDLIYKCLDDNFLVSSFAKEELVKRYPFDVSEEISDEILVKIIKNLSLEQIWEIVSKSIDNKLGHLAFDKLNDILEYAKNINKIDYYNKVNEDNKTIRLLK